MDNPQHAIPHHTDDSDTCSQDENRYYYLFEQSNDAVFLLKLNGEHMECNLRAAQLFGYTKQELEAMSFRELSKDVESSADVFQRLLLGQHVPIYERVFRHKDGHEIICEVNIQVVHDLNGKPLYFQSLLRDVSKRKRLEEELRASEERYRSVVTALSEGIVMQDADGNVLTANETASSILGLTHDQLMGRAPYQGCWQAIHGDGTPFDLQDLPATVTLRTSIPLHNVIMGVTHPDNKQVWISVNSQPLFKPNAKKPYAVVTSLTDITEWRLAQQNALKAALEHERVTMLTRFIEHAAHEFRTPLSIINSSVYLMTHNHNTEKQGNYQRVIEEQVMRVTRLVDMLLQMTMLNTQTDFPMMLTSLEDILCDTVGHTQTASISMTCDIPERLPLIYLNPDLIHQALRELLENAKRHTPNGGIINVRAEVRGEFVAISVQDNGEGIAPECLSHIFETFWRADDAHSTPGLGLGLSITQRIIEKHGGHIEVESTPAQGSRFTVWLPRPA